MTFIMLLPNMATLRPWLAAQFITCCMRWTLDENVAIIILFPSALANSLSKLSPTIRSLGVKPVRSELVESLIRAKTPSLPSWASLGRSIIPPSIGV